MIIAPVAQVLLCCNTAGMLQHSALRRRSDRATGRPIRAAISTLLATTSCLISHHGTCALQEHSTKDVVVALARGQAKGKQDSQTQVAKLQVELTETAQKLVDLQQQHERLKERSAAEHVRGSIRAVDSAMHPSCGTCFVVLGH
jgi:hypothetical protein